MIKNLVSVIIPTYNRGLFIERCVRSVLAQTYSPIEVIVVDDCSKDDTVKKVEILSKMDSRVRLIKLEKNSGACVARNKGIEQSKGEYLAFLDSDDVFEPEKIQKQVKLIEKTGADLCATEYIYWDKKAVKQIQRIPIADDAESFRQLLYCNFVTTGTLLGRKECFMNINFDISMPRYQDWDLVIRLFKNYSFCFVHEPLLIQYYQRQSITASTSHEKSYYALKKIFDKNMDDYNQKPLPYSQISWLIGLHSLYCKGAPEWRKLLIGATCNGLKLRRIGILGMYLLGLKKIVNRFI